MKIVSIVGRKNTGKTSLTVKVIEELTNRGYNVASIKHSHHTMEMDRENTDTWKHKNAGSNVVVGIGSTTFFNIRKTLDLNRLLYLIKHMDNVDYVVIEGFKSYNYPKIATSSEVVDEYTIKQVDSFTITSEGISDLCDLIESKGHEIVDTLFMNNCGFTNGDEISREIRNGNITTDELDHVDTYLSVDNNVVGLNEFVSDYIKQTVLGILSTLHIEEYGASDMEKIELIIRNEQEKNNIEYKQCILEINNTSIEINGFVKKLISNSISGMVTSLNIDYEEIESIDIDIENIKNKELINAHITLKVNEKDISINKFVKGILKESIYGTVRTLAVDDEIKNIHIKIEA